MVIKEKSPLYRLKFFQQGNASSIKEGNTNINSDIDVYQIIRNKKQDIPVAVENCKVVLVGAPQMPKQEFLKTLCCSQKTVLDFVSLSRVIDNINVQFSIWDTPASAIYRSFLSTYLSSAKLIFIMANSIESFNEYYNFCERISGNTCHYCFISTDKELDFNLLDKKSLSIVYYNNKSLTEELQNYLDLFYRAYLSLSNEYQVYRK